MHYFSILYSGRSSVLGVKHAVAEILSFGKKLLMVGRSWLCSVLSDHWES